MSEKRYSLHEVTESLRISPDTLYRWESQIPNLKPDHCDGGRQYTSWEFDLLQHAHRLFHNYNQDFAGTRSALERWISKNPKPAEVEANLDPSENDEQGENSYVSSDLSLKNVETEQISVLDSSLSDLPQEESASVGEQQAKQKSNPLRSSSEEELLGVRRSLSEERVEIDSLSNRPEVVQQEGGKRRVIGRTDEDLFADLDSDPFDLSPRDGLSDPFSMKSFQGQDQQRESSADQLTPALSKLERSFSKPDRLHERKRALDSEMNDRTRLERPSSSDWLEGSTSVENRVIDENLPSSLDLQVQMNTPSERPRFEPKRAFTQPQVSPVSEDPPSISSQDERSVSRPSTHNAISTERSNRESYRSPFDSNPLELKPVPVKRPDIARESVATERVIQTPYGGQTISNSPLGRIQNQHRRLQTAPSFDMTTSSSTLTSSETSSSTLSISDRSPSNIPLNIDPKDQDSWQRAYHHSQAQLARAKGDLARAQDQSAKQKKEIKHLRAQLLSVRESILKEIYDLRDLVVDK